MKRFTPAIFTLALLAAVFTGCVSQAGQPGQATGQNTALPTIAPQAPPTGQALEELECPGCNVLLVSFDALQASHVSHLGYFRNTTPEIDKIAATAYSFENAVNPASWTVPSYMSWFTSTYPSEHKLVNKFSKFSKEEKVLSNLSQLSPGLTTLAQVFKQNGYSTGGFTGDAGVSGFFGYAKGFDVYYDNVTFGGLEYSAPLALEWLEKNKDKPFFMFLHGYDSHGQYVPEKGFDYRFVDSGYTGIYNGSKQQQAELREKGLAGQGLNLTEEDVKFWRAVYDEKIQRADAKFAEFMKKFEEMDLLNNTIIIIASDHGTELYEHGRFDHGFSLYDELIHAPLVVYVPGGKKGVRIKEQVRTIDLMPTIIELTGLKAGEGVEKQMRGVSLVPAMSGEKLELDAFSETDYRRYTYKRSLRKANGWKLIYTLESGAKELYDLKTDPQEKNNLVEKEPAKAYELEQELFGYLKLVGEEPSGEWATGCVPVYADQCK